VASANSRADQTQLEIEEHDWGRCIAGKAFPAFFPQAPCAIHFSVIFM